MKFTAEVEIDWIDEDESIDSVMQQKILNNLTAQITSKFSEGVGNKIAESAERLVTAKTELIINTVLEQPITITKGWNDKTEYQSIYDMVEQRMSGLYEGRLGNGTKCEKDPLLGRIENYVDQKVTKLLKDVDNVLQKHADVAATKAVKENNLIKSLDKIVKINS